MTTSHACRKFSTWSEPSSALKNFMRLSDARLQALSSTNMYSEHGFDALIRCVFLTGFQRLIVVSYCMPGWSMFRITIFAARRVLPPDLIAPAKESNPFMKESGPDAVPPAERPSCAPRRQERLEPVPEPNLKSIPSVFASSRIAAIESPHELMKQAEA